jgi:hypothetical protein
MGWGWRLLQVSACAAVVGACSLSPVVEKNSLDYNGTIEEVSNKSLVTNILRARDGAPLYFPDLSQVRGSVSANISAASTIPWKGPSTGSTTSGPFSASTNPTFDIAPTNTKQFYLGLLNPVSDKLFQYFVARAEGFGSFEEPFHLLVSGIEISSPGRQPRLIPWYAERDRGAEFVALADKWFSEKNPVVMKTKGGPSKPLGPPLPADAKAIVEANSAGLEVRGSADGKMMQLMKAGGGSETVVCFFDGTAFTPVTIVQNSSVKGPASDQPAFIKSVPGCPGNADGTRYALRLRSTEQVFNYLGLLAEENSRFLRPNGSHPGCPRLPFAISSTPTDHVRFSVEYRGSAYYVSDINHRLSCGGLSPPDRTMPILAILNDLLNVNRDANEIPTTKAVQAVGGG